MEVLTPVLLIIILLIVISTKSKINDLLLKFQNEIWKLQDEIKILEHKIDKNIPQSQPIFVPKPIVAKASAPEKQETIPDIKPTIDEIKPLEPIIPAQKHSSNNPPHPISNEYKATTKPKVAYSQSPIPKSTAIVAPKPSFFERNPDLEKFIGENLISKIGIAILVLAISFFVKYAIDNNWIGPAGRVAIGILCGGILVSLAHYLRKNYPAFSGILIGGGFAIFYFTITLAFQQYHLFTQTIAFVIMLVITIFAVILSLLYNRQDTAIISLIGGFTAPFMLSNGSNNYIVLFTYLIILNAGLLFIAYRKSWRLLNFLAFIFTVILMASWAIFSPIELKKIDYKNGFIFASIFYIMFFIINVANNIKENKKFIASDFGILLANTTLYFGVGLLFLEGMELTQYKGLFSAILAVFNLAVTYILMRSKKIDTNILYLLIGITLTFISITAPLQLHGHYITIFWASEMVLLYWLYRKSNIFLIYIASLIVSVGTAFSLLLDWRNAYFNDSAEIKTTLNIILNKGFITGLYCSAGIFIITFLYKRKWPENENGLKLKKYFSPLLSILFPLTLFVTGFLELNYQISKRSGNIPVESIYLILYTFLFSIIYLAASKLNKTNAKLSNIWICLLVSIYLISLPNVLDIQNTLLKSKNSSAPHIIFHWLNALLFIVLIYLLVKQMITQSFHRLKGKGNYTWILAIIIIFFISFEGMLIINSIFYSKPDNLETLQRVYIKTGLPIIWSLTSFAFMWVGMKYKYRELRIISLALFGITLIKLFTFDIQNIPVAGKIAAFFCLGVLLLVVSFMYQRLKKIIIKDENENSF